MNQTDSKNLLWLVGGWFSVDICIFIFDSGLFGYLETPFWKGVVILAPFIVPSGISALVWKRSKAFAVGVACHIIYFFVLFKVLTYLMST